MPIMKSRKRLLGHPRKGLPKRSIHFRSHRSEEHRFVYYRVGHKQTAEDLTSTVFTKAFLKFKTFDSNAQFSNWIISIARNTVIDHYRTSKVSLDLDEAFNMSDSTNISKDYELKEKLVEARKYLDKLPIEQRDLVIMRLWDGLNYEEIAVILGKKESALRVNFSRIMSKMQKEMVFSLILIGILIKG